MLEHFHDPLSQRHCWQQVTCLCQSSLQLYCSLSPRTMSLITVSQIVLILIVCHCHKAVTCNYGLIPESRCRTDVTIYSSGLLSWSLIRLSHFCLNLQVVKQLHRTLPKLSSTWLPLRLAMHKSLITPTCISIPPQHPQQNLSVKVCVLICTAL